MQLTEVKEQEIWYNFQSNIFASIFLSMSGSNCVSLWVSRSIKDNGGFLGAPHPRLNVHFHAFLRRNWLASPHYGCHLPATWIRHWLIAVREHHGPSKVSLAPSILTKNTGFLFWGNADIKDRLHDKCIFVDCISFKGCLSRKLAFPGSYNKSIETHNSNYDKRIRNCLCAKHIHTNV